MSTVKIYPQSPTIFDPNKTLSGFLVANQELWLQVFRANGTTFQLIFDANGQIWPRDLPIGTAISRGRVNVRCVFKGFDSSPYYRVANEQWFLCDNYLHYKMAGGTVVCVKGPCSATVQVIHADATCIPVEVSIDVYT